MIQDWYLLDLFQIITTLKKHHDDTSIIIDNLLRLKLIEHPSAPHLPFPNLGGVPFSSLTGNLTTTTSLLTTKSENREIKKLAEYLEKEARQAQNAERFIQLTSLGYSLIKACTEPDIT